MNVEEAFEEICNILNEIEFIDALNILATLLKAGLDGITPIEKRIEVINDITLFLKEIKHAAQ